MASIVLIPDTNIFIGCLQILKRLIEDKFPFNLIIRVPRTILEELDFQKSNSKPAREAIRYIKDNIHGTTIFIEDQDIMEIESDAVHNNHIEVKVNDDKILKFVNSYENGIIVTKDIVLSLKAQNYKIKCIYLETIKYLEFKNKLFKYFSEYEMMEICGSEDFAGGRDALVESVGNKISPVFRDILDKQLGKAAHVFLKNENFTLEDMLDYITKHFSLFTDYIPTNSLELIQNIKINLRNEKHENYMNDMKDILTLFRIDYREIMN